MAFIYIWLVFICTLGWAGRILSYIFGGSLLSHASHEGMERWGQVGMGWFCTEGRREGEKKAKEKDGRDQEMRKEMGFAYRFFLVWIYPHRRRDAYIEMNSPYLPILDTHPMHPSSYHRKLIFIIHVPRILDHGVGIHIDVYHCSFVGALLSNTTIPYHTIFISRPITQASHDRCPTLCV